MNRRIALRVIPGIVVAAATTRGLMVPALGADAKSANGAIELHSVWARASKTRETAAYLDILNHGTMGDRLLAVSSPTAGKCLLQKAHWSGLNLKVMTLDDLEIPPMSRVRLRPGQTYIAVLGLSQSLENKSELPLSFQFAGAGQLDVSAELTIRKLGPLE